MFQTTGPGHPVVTQQGIRLTVRAVTALAERQAMLAAQRLETEVRRPADA
ncbi:hypothetical protein [Streptomyces sp. S4.7]|nr:hypothetical protein [Streptomyces sp. S4.7]